MSPFNICCGLILGMALFVSGCVRQAPPPPTYPGGMSEMEWNALPADRRAELTMQQQQLDEQRRANDNHQTLVNNTPVQNQSVDNYQTVQQPNVVADQAPPTKWVVIGQQSIDNGADHVTFPVGMVAGSWHAVRFGIDRGSLEIRRLAVIFGNGDTLDTGIYGRFDDKSISSPILFPKGDQRKIDHVEIQYHSRGRAVVTVFGGR